MACTVCRRRKLKCDNVRPACGTCDRLNKPCTYIEAEEKRGPKRRKVDVLEQRLAELEAQVVGQPSRTPSDVQPVSSDQEPLGPDAGFPLEQPDEPGLPPQSEPAAPPGQEDVFDDFNLDFNTDFGSLINLGQIEELPPEEMRYDLIYFKEIHPLSPFVHERRFRSALSLSPSEQPPLCLRYALWALGAIRAPEYSMHAETFYQRSRHYLQNDEMQVMLPPRFDNSYQHEFALFGQGLRGRESTANDITPSRPEPWTSVNPVCVCITLGRGGHFGRISVHLDAASSDDGPGATDSFWDRHREIDHLISMAFLSLPPGLNMSSVYPNVEFYHMNLHAATITLHNAVVRRAQDNGMEAEAVNRSERRSGTAAEEILEAVKSMAHKEPKSMNSMKEVTKVAPFFVKQILKDLRLKGIEFPGLEFQPFDLPLGADEALTASRASLLRYATQRNGDDEHLVLGTQDLDRSIALAPSNPYEMEPPRVLVCGAGIAGAVVAYWLGEAGANVLVIEKAPAVRKSGLGIDFRGAALDVIRSMGLEDAVRAKVTHERGLTFVDSHNRTFAAFPVTGEKGFTITSEIEIMRGDLDQILCDAASSMPNVEFEFDCSVASLAHDEHSVTAEFSNGRRETFDLLIAADGLASRTRRLIVGRDRSDQAVRSLNAYVAYFTIPRESKDGELARCYQAVGRRNLLIRPKNDTTSCAFLSIITQSERVRNIATASTQEQKALWAELFADAGWEAQRMISGMQNAEDFYLQHVAQISEAHGDAAVAFGKYEERLRPYVERVQKLPPGIPKAVNPETWWGLWIHNCILWIVSSLRLVRLAGLFGPKTEGFELPTYRFEATDWSLGSDMGEEGQGKYSTESKDGEV
ncbi:hypothetical protein H2203_005752 [Taxawa tesnikishii (nom. ined.)]|nr:hypothetical protein H2203_005752 [Dothideales sp. JES 119]